MLLTWLNWASDPVDTSVVRKVTKAKTLEDGFTLVELLVVVLVIAILMAIAIPSFLGARSRALDRAAQVNVRHALTAEHIVFTDNQQYSAASATMTATEPRLIYVSAVPAKDSPEVYLGTDATSETVVLGARSGSGKCFWARQASPANNGALRWNQSTDCTSPPAVDDAGFTLDSAPA